MNSHLHRTLFPQAVVIWTAIIATAGCEEKSPITSWNSPRMLRIQHEWESLLDTGTRASGPDAVEKYGFKHEKLLGMLDDIITKQLTKEDLRRLAATCDELPVRVRDRSEFAEAVLGYMVKAFVDSGDRKTLVKVLSTRFPPRVDEEIHRTTETYLLAFGAKLKAPIMVLGEAYSECRDPVVRHDIAAAVRRGFADLGIHGEDDAEFVKNAMQWYEKEKHHLVFNHFYSRNDEVFPLEDYEKHPEFYKTLAGRRNLLLIEKGTEERVRPASL
jgi:hypothetical protein